ncbi:MAG: penicillin-binding protein 2, partial [Pseudomonadota bacterium]
MSRDGGLVRMLGGGDDAAAVLARRAADRRLKREARRRMRAERSEWRLGLVCLFLLLGYGLLGARMTLLAASEPREPRLASSSDAAAQTTRASIVDRNGRLLASNLPTWAIYAHPTEMKKAGVEPADAARRLAAALPGVPEEVLRKRFETRKGLVWVKRPATPAERQAAHDLGLPGVHFGRRETRFYPAGRIAAHILGGARVGEETVGHAELVGRAGVERALDDLLRDPARA